jgi:hygromycin-B 7''-O-kinase
MLPAVRTDEEWQAVVFDEKIVRPAAEDLTARLGLAGAGLRRYPGGSRPVYAVGDRRVLKLYPTVSAPDSVTEARVLDYLSGRLPVATLLHVHSNLPECLSELPAPPEPTLDSLALTWFGTA